MVNNYQLNYFWNLLLLLEMLLIHFYNLLNQIDIKNNYQIKNSSFVFVFFKIIFYYLFYSNKYFEYVQSKNKNYLNNLISLPDNYGEIAYYIGKDILNIIEGNSCFCEKNINIENKFYTIKFNLLFSDFEIKINLLDMFNYLENKICTSDQSLRCRVKNKSMVSKLVGEKNNKSKVDFENLPNSLKSLLSTMNQSKIRKYHTSSRVNNKIIKMTESDFIIKEKK